MVLIEALAKAGLLSSLPEIMIKVLEPSSTPGLNPYKEAVKRVYQLTKDKIDEDTARRLQREIDDPQGLQRPFFPPGIFDKVNPSNSDLLMNWYPNDNNSDAASVAYRPVQSGGPIADTNILQQQKTPNKEFFNLSGMDTKWSFDNNSMVNWGQPSIVQQQNDLDMFAPNFMTAYYNKTGRLRDVINNRA